MSILIRARRKVTSLETPPEVLRMYQRAQQLKCSKLARELRREEQQRMTIADESTREANEEWRRRDNLELRRLKRQAFEHNRALIMNKLESARSIWARATLRKALGGFFDIVEERKFRELKAERWYLTVIRLKSIKAFTIWLEWCRRDSNRAREFQRQSWSCYTVATLQAFLRFDKARLRIVERGCPYCSRRPGSMLYSYP